MMKPDPRIRHALLLLATIAAAAAFPLVMQALNYEYYISFGSRVMIYALAATSLNLILGYGGMISFGHAAFVGAGAYTAGILIVEGSSSALIAWPLAMLVAGLLALVIGAISLRTRGMYFIMITLAFAQMIYFITVSMKAYGGEEGLALPARPAVPFIGIKDDLGLYYVILLLLCATIYLINRIISSRFGRVLEATRENEIRMEAIGYPTLRYKLAAFVIAGAFGGLAGALLANQNNFVNPSIMHWTKSGTLMIMVILGGVRHRYGGVVGALVLLGLEDLIAHVRIDWLEQIYPNYAQHSMLGVGIILLIIVLYAPQGIAGLFRRRRKSND
ncbi:MAG: branched-chain amino acid ABC transporter permease [Pseudomonadota bacterium]